MRCVPQYGQKTYDDQDDMVGGETKWPLAQGKRPVQVRANMIADGDDHDENIDDDGDGDDDDNDGDYDDGATEEYEG